MKEVRPETFSRRIVIVEQEGGWMLWVNGIPLLLMTMDEFNDLHIATSMIVDEYIDAQSHAYR